MAMVTELAMMAMLTSSCDDVQGFVTNTARCMCDRAACTRCMPVIFRTIDESPIVAATRPAKDLHGFGRNEAAALFSIAGYFIQAHLAQLALTRSAEWIADA